MKLFLIGFAVWFVLGFGIQFIKAWFWEIVFKRKKKRASQEDQWLYE